MTQEVEDDAIEAMQHVVILMLDNRSFDHYFGTLRGVRGFGDRHPVPLASAKPVWYQSDGEKEIPPFHLNSQTSSALRFPGSPHTFSDAQKAWAQARFGLWQKFKTPMSMGHFRREDIPFQFALAGAFTICDAHHCSVTTGTDPNAARQAGLEISTPQWIKLGRIPRQVRASRRNAVAAFVINLIDAFTIRGPAMKEPGEEQLGVRIVPEDLLVTADREFAPSGLNVTATPRLGFQDSWMFRVVGWV
jgi:hypothetical protein